MREPPKSGVLSHRQPPCNLQAEQALLGALLANNGALARVDFVEPKHFADPVNACVFDAIRQRVASGGVADAITLRQRFAATDELAPVGGVAYLAQLLASMVGIINAAEYGRVVRDSWERRQLIDIGETLVNSAFDGSKEPTALAGQVAAHLDDVISSSSTRRKAYLFNTAMDEAIQAADRAVKAGGVIGISTGLSAVDEMIGGLEPGTVTVLAGRPGMGKTGLGLGIAVHAARCAKADRQGEGKPGGVAYISLEMSAEELARRTLAAAAGIGVINIKRGPKQREFDRLITSRRELDGLPLVIDDSSGLTPSMIKMRLRSMRRLVGGRLALIVVDHLHIVKPEDADSKHGGTHAVGKVSNSMKVLAKDFGCPVIALAQLNRNPEGREDKRPTLADLRQAGDIEQDADVVGLLYRHDYYLREPERGSSTPDAYRATLRQFESEMAGSRGRAELIFAKVRDGATGTVHLSFDGPTASFQDASND